MMLEFNAHHLLALKEILDWRVATTSQDVSTSVIEIPGEQFVKLSGGHLMLKLLVYNWDYQVQVMFKDILVEIP